jgi:hypothetical protein
MRPWSRFGFAAVSVVCLVVCAAVTPADPPKDDTPAWAEELLKEVKLTPDKAQLEPTRWTVGGPHRLNTFQRLADDWRLIDPTARTTAKNFLAGDTFDELVATAAPFLDVKPPAPPAPAVKEVPADEALVRAITALHAALDKPLSDEQKKQLGKRVKAVPEAVARAAAELLDAVPRALKLREKAFAKFGGADKLSEAYDRAFTLAKDYKADADTRRMIQDVDMLALVEGGRYLARAMDRAEKLLAKVPAEKFEFAWETPIGSIALNGTQDNTYGAGPYLVIIDTGGNDKYASGGASTSADHPISLLIDLAGDDTYESKDGPAFGAGVLGYGFLLDVAGNDTYRVEHVGCGAASFGVGVLIDRDGKDKYEVDRGGQGAAFVGAGILADLAGDDEYHCFMHAQGFGGVRGCGVLVDRAGNDKYEADDTDIRYPSAQDAKHNTSFAQGAACGLRDHPGGGNSLAGGAGILIDGKGDDRYSCGVFGQGVGYWYGLGMLIDLDGDDRYTGIWYVQASAAHFSVGVLVDVAGNDKYLAKMTMGQGAAHDYSVAWFHDVAGNDTYECPKNCMGFALYNGVGIFWDGAGDDTYKTTGEALGATGETRPQHMCLGLFIDEGGKNTFPEKGRAKPKSVWVQPANKDQPHAFGVGASK